MDIPLIARLKSRNSIPTFVPRPDLDPGKSLKSTRQIISLKTSREEVFEASYDACRTGIWLIPEVDPDEFERVYLWFLS